MSALRAIHPICFLFLALASTLCPSPAAAQDPFEISRLPALRDSIIQQRELGDYDRALAFSESLLGLCRDGGARDFELGDARRLVRTLRHILSLGEGTRREMARAEALSPRIRALLALEDRRGAMATLREQIAIRRSLLGENHPEVALGLFELGGLHVRAAQYAQGDSLYRRALRTQVPLLGADHPAVLDTRSAIAEIHLRRGEYERAEPVIQDVLERRRRVLGRESVAVAKSLSRFGQLRWKQGRFAEAESRFREALALRLLLLGDRDPSVASTVSDVGLMLMKQGKNREAEVLLLEALELEGAVAGDESRDFASILGNLGSLMNAMGEFERAEGYFRESLRIHHALLGERSIQTGIAKHNLASVLESRGDREGAEQLYRENLTLWMDLLGERHPYIYLTIKNIASINADRGNWAAAGALYQRVLTMRREANGDQHPDIARDLADLGALAMRRGDRVAARRHLSDALEMNRRLLPPDDPAIVSNLHSLSMLFTEMGEYARAEALLTESTALRRSRIGEEHPWIARDLLGFARLRELMGDLPGAERYLRSALTMRQSALGEEHRLVAEVLGELGRLLTLSGAYGEAELHLEEALAMSESLVGDVEGPVANALLRLGELAFAREDDVAAERWLGRAAERIADSPRSVRAHGRVSRNLILSKLAAVQLLLGKETEAWRSVAAERRGAIRELERFAGQGVTGEFMPDGDPLSGGSLDELQEALGSRTGLLGWLEVERRPGVFLSWAWLVREEGPPDWFLLPALTGETSDSPGESVREFGRTLSDPGRRGSDSGMSRSLEMAARAMWRARIAPLAESIDALDALFIVPSGAMLGIPVESFMDPIGVNLGERFAISYLPSAEVPAGEKRRSSEQSGALLLGDPLFRSPDAPFMSELSPASGRGGAGEAALLAMRSAVAGNRQALVSLWPMPWTQIEVERAAQLLPGALVLLGAEASEDRLVALAANDELASYRVLHLATHALVDDAHPERSALVLSQTGLPDPVASALAGEQVMDGLLSVAEIFGGWRLGAELVTLSACESRLGREVGGEGYLGFVNGFLAAGARSVLISLWGVNDESTALLTGRFYEEWRRLDRRGRSGSKAEALRLAKSWLSEYRDESGALPYAHPYYWAGFVLFGAVD